MKKQGLFSEKERKSVYTFIFLTVGIFILGFVLTLAGGILLPNPSCDLPYHYDSCIVPASNIAKFLDNLGFILLIGSPFFAGLITYVKNRRKK